MRAIMILLCGFCLTLPCMAETLSEAKFTVAYVEALKKAEPKISIEKVEDLHLKIKSSDGNQIEASLDNAYKEYSSNPERRDEIIGRYVRTASKAIHVDEIKFDRSQVIPIFKDRGWVEAMKKQAVEMNAKQGEHLVVEDYNTDLVIVYALDTPENIRYIRPEVLQEEKLDLKELRALSIENLKKHLPPVEYHGTKGVVMITAGGNFEVSLLLLPSVWDRNKIKVKGEYVIAVPSRDMLLVTGSEDLEGIAKVKSMADKVYKEENYPLTPNLYIFKETRFVPYEAEKK